MFALAGLLTASIDAAAAAASRAPERVEAQVAQAARKLLAEQTEREGLAKPQIEIISVAGTRAPAACRQPVAVTALDLRFPNRMRLIATCLDEKGWRQEFAVRAEVSAEVVVAVTAVPAGRAMTDSELTLERRDISATPDAMSDIDAATDMSSRRALRAGQIVQKQMLSAPLLVKRGDTVNIVVRSGPIAVSVAGEALGAGQLGEVVRVRNLSTGKIIRTRIIDSATVEPVDMIIPPHSRD